MSVNLYQENERFSGNPFFEYLKYKNKQENPFRKTIQYCIFVFIFSYIFNLTHRFG